LKAKNQNSENSSATNNEKQIQRKDTSSTMYEKRTSETGSNNNTAFTVDAFFNPIVRWFQENVIDTVPDAILQKNGIELLLM
jgi:hypothetical protein